MLDSFPTMFQNNAENENLGVLLCLMPLVQPDLLDELIKAQMKGDTDMPSIGGLRGTQYRGILPTGETWMSICCGDNHDERIKFIQSIPSYLSSSTSLLQIEPNISGEPFLSGKLSFSKYFRQKFQQYNLVYEQRLANLQFGHFISSKLTLEDLVLSDEILQSIEEIKQWQYFTEKTFDYELPFLKRIKQGLKVLFYGKSGTGKTETTAILGNILQKEVYRIDISQMVSKYIGETEKNLSMIFDVAERKDWILFFDEADALFGKRTSVNSSNDKYANQEVAYLLQRIEDYAGIIILSSNLKDNIDQAFTRRFQIICEFHLPDEHDRLKIWQKLLNELQDMSISLDDDSMLKLNRYEISGGAITNIIHYAFLKARYLKIPIDFKLLLEGLKRELRKEGRTSSIVSD